jgi:MFS family permease
VDASRAPGPRLLLGVSVFWLALSALSDGLTTLVLPRQLADLVADERRATVLGAVTAVGLFAAMLVQPVAGAASDRLGSRWGRRGFVALGALLALAALALLGAAGTVWAIAGAYLLVQVAASVAQAGQQGYLPDLVPPDRRGTAAGLKAAMDTGGALVAFLAIGGLLAGGLSWALLGAGAVVAVALALTLLLVGEEPRDAAVPPRLGLLDAFRVDLRAHRAFARLVAARFLFLLGAYAVGRFFLFYVADRLRLDAGRAAAEAGALLGALTLLTVLAAPPAGLLADRLGRPPLMAAGAALSTLGALVLIPASSGAVILLGGGLMALGSGAFGSANWAQTADAVPPAEAGRFMALANLGTAGGAAAAGLLGPLVDAAGYPALFAAAALAFAASGLITRMFPTGEADDRRGLPTAVPAP